MFTCESWCTCTGLKSTVQQMAPHDRNFSVEKGKHGTPAPLNELVLFHLTLAARTDIWLGHGEIYNPCRSNGGYDDFPIEIHCNMVNKGEYMNTPPLMENILGDIRESYGNIFDIENSCGIWRWYMMIFTLKPPFMEDIAGNIWESKMAISKGNGI